MKSRERCAALKDDETGADDRFRQLSEELCEMAGREGTRIVPYCDPKLPSFSALSLHQKFYVIGLLETLVDISRLTASQNLKLMSARSSLWGFIRRSRLTMPANMLAHVSELFLVDVYDLNHKMMFANLRFFELVTYTVEELYCHPWTELFDRSTPHAQDQLWKLSEEMVRGVHHDIVSTEYIGNHITTEPVSRKHRKFLVQPQFFAPLYKQGELHAYVCVNSAMILPE